MRLLWLCVMITMGSDLWAQCDNPNFSVTGADKLCRNSPVRLLNEDTQAQRYYWDFCPEVFKEQAAKKTNTLAGFEQGYGYKLVEEEGQWYGFTVSRSLDKIFRLDFGSNPENAPVVTDLGNPGGLMDAPEGIALYEDSGEWFAFIGKGDNSTGQIVKLYFGSKLTNLPSATGYGTFGITGIRVRDLLITKQGSDIILVLLIYNYSTVNRVNFGNSLHNSPAANNITAIPGALFPRAIELLPDCARIRAHIVCENGSVHQISFGNDVLGPISTEGSFTFPSVIQPWKIRSFFSAGKFFTVISNNNRKFSIIDFGDLSLTTPPSEVGQPNDVRLIGFDVLKYEGTSIIQGVGGANILTSVSYKNTCQVSEDFTYEKSPTVWFTAEGNYTIDLTAFSGGGHNAAFSLPIAIRGADAPDVKISYTGICQDNAVGFSASNGNLISAWAWDLGEGTVSALSSPVTTYSSPGSFEVTLDAIGNNSCFAGDKKLIKIYPAPDADFQLPAGLLCTNNSVTFAATILDVYDGNLSYNWYIDNEPASTARDLIHTFTSTGRKEIRLNTSIPGCSSDMTKSTSQLESGPVIDFSFTGSCEGDAFSFENHISDPVESVNWQFGTGDVSVDDNPEYVFTRAGEYLVTLSAINEIGCQTVKNELVPVHSKPLVSFSAEGPPNACSQQETHFVNETINPDGRSIGEWLWTFGDPHDDASVEGQFSSKHIYREPGLYKVSLTASSTGGCIGFLEKEVPIYPSPSSGYVRSPACEDIAVSFSSHPGEEVQFWYWEIGTSYYYTPSPVHTFAAPGNYPLYAEFYGANGCISTVRETISIPQPLSPDFSVSKNCVGEQAAFTDITTGTDPVAVRTWTFPDGASSSSLTTSHVFSQEGEEAVKLHLVTTSGCSYAVTKEVNIVQPPSAEFSSSTAVGAYPLEVTFTNSSAKATTFLWDFDDASSSTSTEESPQHTFFDAREFKVTLTASNQYGCEDKSSRTISTIAPMPDVEVELINVVTNHDGSGKLIITIYNKGNTIVKDLPVSLGFEGKLVLEELIPTAISPAERFNFIFNSSIMDPSSLRYVCASLDLPNDVVPQDNRTCREFQNELYVFPVYPNPVTKELAFEWMSSPEKTVSVLLRDALGRTILRNELTGSTGLNLATIDISAVRDGVYFLIIHDGASENIQRILVSGNP